MLGRTRLPLDRIYVTLKDLDDDKERYRSKRWNNRVAVAKRLGCEPCEVVIHDEDRYSIKHFGLKVDLKTGKRTRINDSKWAWNNKVQEYDLIQSC